MAIKLKTKNQVTPAVATSKVRQSAEGHRKARAATRAARDRLDQSMFDAKQAGATYRDIADAADVSTAWVQGALERCGYETAAR